MKAEESILIERLKKGERTAFNELYGIFWAPLVNYAELIVGDENADDVVQEVFVRIWVGRDKLRNDGSLRGYLLRAVYRTALQQYYGRKTMPLSYRSQTKLQIEQQLCTYYDPDENEIIRNLYARQIADELDAVVETLSPKCREVFRMSHFEGLSNREISERLNISVSTVENHIYNALRQLRGKLGHLKMFLLLTIYILGQ